MLDVVQAWGRHYLLMFRPFYKGLRQLPLLLAQADEADPQGCLLQVQLCWKLKPETLAQLVMSCCSCWPSDLLPPLQLLRSCPQH